MEASTEEPDEAAILGEWYMASHHLTPYVPKDDEELPSLGNPQIRNYAHDMIQKRKVGMRFLTSISHRYHEVRVSSMYLNMCIIMHLS